MQETSAASQAAKQRQWPLACYSREEALYRAHTGSGLRISVIAQELGLSVSWVCRLIPRTEQAKGKS